MWIAALLVSSLSLWLLGRGWVTQRTITLQMSVEHAGAKWSWEWARRNDGRVNGAWVDLCSRGAGEDLIIRPSGQSQEPDQPYEFWLYHATPLGPKQAEPDLKQIIADANPEQVRGRWVPFDLGPGVVYVGTEPGMLKLRIPPGGVSLESVVFPRGGRVEIEYAGQTRTLNLHGSPQRHVWEVFARQAPHENEPLMLTCDLPKYKICDPLLKWWDSPGVRLTVEAPRLEIRLLGRLVHTRPLIPVAVQNAHEVDQAGATYRFQASAEPGAIQFCGGTGIGLAANVLGGIGTFAGLSLLALLAGCLRWIIGAARRWEWSLALAALLLIMGIRLWMNAWAPMLLLRDSLEYIHNAAVFLQTGNLSHVYVTRPAGYSVLLAPLMALRNHYLVPLGWLQAALGVGTAVLCYAMLKPHVRRPWPAVVMLLVGLDPILLAYEHMVMTETLATFLLTLTCWAATRTPARHAEDQTRWLPSLLLAAGIGLLCGVSAYVRGNFLVLVVAIPILLVVSGWGRMRKRELLARAAGVMIIGAGVLVPWMLRNQRQYGSAQFMIGKEFAHAVYAWNQDVIDDNQTAAFSFEQWKHLQERKAAGLTEFGFVDAVATAPGIPGPGAPSWPVVVENRCGPVVEESIARQPRRALAAMARTFANVLDLWTHFEQRAARENAHWSQPLRGDLSASKTNWFFTLADFPPEDEADREPLQRRALYKIEHLESSSGPKWFRELYSGWNLARPLFAVLLLIGTGFALRDRKYALAGAGLLVLANAAALAVLLMACIDRYGVPLKPLMMVMAVYALSRLAGWGTGKHAEN